MLIPLRHDAPLYHRPWGTVAIIVLCLFVHVTVGQSEILEDWILEYGSWNPLQWLSSVVVHAGWVHLLGNVIFLWIFGLLVEGKVGWWRFAAITTTIAIASGCVEQTVVLGATGGSLGISGVIYGLIAVSWLWAPDNEIDLLIFFPPFIRHVELKVRDTGLIFIGLEILSAALDGFQMSTPALHLLGAAAGAPIGYLMLKKSWVNCEGWDLFSRRSTAGVKPTPSKQPEEQPTADALIGDVDDLLAAGATDAALSVWQIKPDAHPIGSVFRLATRLLEAKRWSDAERVAHQLLQRDPTHVHAVLVRAWALVHLDRPASALELLAGLGDLDPADAKKRDAIRVQAHQRVAEVPYEMS